MLGTPSAIALMCPLLDRGAREMVSFIHTKVYSQSGPLSTNRNLRATSSRVWRQAKWGLAHTAVRPKTHSHPALVHDTISMKAISHWGFSASPQAPAWKRVTSCSGMISHTWNCIATGQKSKKPTWILWTLPTDGRLWKAAKTCSW